VYRDLLRPKWLIGHLGVALLATGFVLLGLWQLDRHRERLADSEIGQARLAEAPVPLSGLLEGDPQPGSLRYRRVLVEGVFDPHSEVLVRSQVHLGSAGFHVVTPLVGEEGRAVLVNRGWVPLALDSVPVEEAPPPEGSVIVEGWVELSRERPALGPEDPPTERLQVVSRVDIVRIQTQVEVELVPVYVVMTGGGEGVLPEPVRPPVFDDHGPHLGYAIQWFGFALIGVVGYLVMIRRRLRPGQKARFSTTW
jgi:surfeit locus 1 family protein